METADARIKPDAPELPDGSPVPPSATAWRRPGRGEWTVSQIRLSDVVRARPGVQAQDGARGHRDAGAAEDGEVVTLQ